NRASIVTTALQLCLNINHDLVRCQLIVSVDWSIVRIISARVIAPGWIPVTVVPVPPSAADEGNSVVVMPPPVAVVRLPVIITKRSVLPATELAAAPVIRYRHVSVSVDRHVGCRVTRVSSVAKVPIPVNRGVGLHTSP